MSSDSADLVVADGMPLVWLGRWQGHNKMKRRVYGPELMETFCRETGSKYRHFFYGGAPGVADHLAQVEHERYGIQIAGTYCPAFPAAYRRGTRGKCRGRWKLPLLTSCGSA